VGVVGHLQTVFRCKFRSKLLTNFRTHVRLKKIEKLTEVSKFLAMTLVSVPNFPDGISEVGKTTRLDPPPTRDLNITAEKRPSLPTKLTVLFRNKWNLRAVRMLMTFVIIVKTRCRPEADETICPTPPTAVRRWQKPREIYVRLYTCVRCKTLCIIGGQHDGLCPFWQTARSIFTVLLRCVFFFEQINSLSPGPQSAHL